MIAYMGQLTASEITNPDEEIQEAIEANAREQKAENFLEWLKNGPQRLVSWLGNNEIHVGGTMVKTASGQLVVKTGATQQDLAKMSMPGAFSWWETMPNYIKYGVPAAALFLLLKK